MSDKIAVVTGCATGLGLALVKQLLARNYRVIATSRDASSIPLDHPRLYKTSLLLNQPERFPEQVEQWRKDIGPVQLLINNAGYAQMGPIIEIPADELQSQFLINVIAPLALAQALLPQLEATREGHIINIGSVSAHLTTPFAGAYCASKSALHTLNDALRRELQPLGIRVQGIMAGGIRSHFGETATTQLTRVFGQDSRYHSIANSVYERAALSQKNGEDADSVAETLVQVALKHPDKPYITLAAGARSLYATSRLPTRLLDLILARRFGLNKLNNPG